MSVLMLRFWYPGDVGSIAGGRQLFLLILSVDVVMGPFLTLIAFNSDKPPSELRRDLGVIVVLQLVALAYGLYTTYLARPVGVVFESERFRLVAAVDVRKEELPDARPEYRTLPLTGPLLLGAQTSRTSEERQRSIDLALSGFDIGQRPGLWKPYAEVRAEAWAQARPLEQLASRNPRRRDELAATLQEMGLKMSECRFLPLIARGNWVVVLRPGGDVAGYLPFDGFF